ncbi:MAG TPA: glycosyltransferase family 4 protein [Chloroflexia bacterium]
MNQTLPNRELQHTTNHSVLSPQSSSLKVLWIWHAAVVAEYQKPVRELAGYPDLDVTLMLPRRWPERAGQMVRAETLPGASFRVIVARTVFTGFYYIYFFPSLIYHLLRLRPDIVYCYEEAHTLMGALVLLLRRLFMPRTRVLLYAAQNIKKKYPLPFRLFERYCFRNTDMILACGTTVARTLRSKGYRGPLRVVPLPTDTCAFAPDSARRHALRQELEIPQDALVLLYAGKLVEEKGLLTLWRAFEEVAGEHDNAYLVLAGGGPLKSEIEAMSRDAGLESRVRLPGIVHNTELPSHINAADVFVLPSETRSNWREQFGRVAVEAMSCAVPVVGSDSGEIPTVLGDAGLVFHEGDSAGMAAHIRHLLSDPTLRAQLGQRGRARVLRLFSIERVAAQHYNVYRVMRTED